MVKISAVSYLNTTPFIFGIEKSGFLNPADYLLQRDFPSLCAQRLIKGDAQIGIVPVAALPLLSHFHILDGYCIGANGPVDSVLLVCNRPISEIEKIYLDYQSVTSVKLCRILAKDFWQIQPAWIQAPPNYIDLIDDTTGGVIIGDRALEIKDKFKFRYDLSETWKIMTGLPFVFACWVYDQQIEKSFIIEFQNALTFGIENVGLVAANEEKHYPRNYNVTDYLMNKISYEFDENKIKAMKKFLALAENLKPIYTK